MMAGRKLITVFSAPNYCGQFTNAAAIVCLDEDLQVESSEMHISSFEQFSPNLNADLFPTTENANPSEFGS